MTTFIQKPDNSFGFSNVGSTPTFTSSQSNPFGLQNVGNFSAPTFADIDEDGDLDAFIGNRYGDTTYFQNTGTASSPSFASYKSNPFGLSNVGNFSKPTFDDIDGDGDLDAFIGHEDGNTTYFQNTTELPYAPAVDATIFNITPLENASPTFAAIDSSGVAPIVGSKNGFFNYFQATGPKQYTSPPIPNPSGLEPLGSYSTPAFVDIDNDGDQDAFTGSGGAGNIYFFWNTGTAEAPVFGKPYPLLNPFQLSSVPNGHLAFVDIDSDGDQDAFIGDIEGYTSYFENTGTATNAQFTLQNSRAFFQKVGSYSAPTFFDYDDDGDFDAFVGAGDGNIYYSENEGTATDFEFASFTVNPFGITNVGSNSTPAFFGINHPKDLFIGSGQGVIYYFAYTPPLLSGAGGQKPFAITPGDGTVHISNFGGVGSGVNPAAAVIEEVDTLQFTGADLTPEKLLLTQQGNDLFVLAANTGTDTVKDFQNGKDHLGLAEGLTFNQLTISQSNNNTLISVTNGGEVLASLTGMNANLIGTADFSVV